MRLPTGSLMTQARKVALVTGAGSGIGRAVAVTLLNNGFDTVLAGRRLDALEATAKLAAGAGTESLTVATDVGDPLAVDAPQSSASGLAASTSYSTTQAPVRRRCRWRT